MRRLRNNVNPDGVKAGYGIRFTRYFYQPQPLRAPERESEGLLSEIFSTEGVNQ